MAGAERSWRVRPDRWFGGGLHIFVVVVFVVVDVCGEFGFDGGR
jgi:hypothetical protein